MSWDQLEVKGQEECQDLQVFLGHMAYQVCQNQVHRDFQDKLDLVENLDRRASLGSLVSQDKEVRMGMASQDCQE